MNALSKANQIKKLAINAANDCINNYKYFGRQFDNLLEEGDGDQVVIEFIKIYNIDPELQKAVGKLTHWIPIEAWLKFYKEWERKTPTLF
ncbi:hypothetical protein [Nitrosophilus labii]|uniref:hypothetical protein n=1 Tax=Nitrosophilus labii TaxID=2706014 RepID=UPI001656F40E|nr:hypothetical protein [Nitrosophilus labii]